MVNNLENVLRIALQSFIAGARRTGRTSAMIEGLRPGDYVIAPTPQVGTAIARRMRELGRPNTGIQICAPTLAGLSEVMPGLVGRLGDNGRIVFDHTWLEAYYDKALTSASDELAMLVGAAVAKRRTTQQPAAFDPYGR